MVRLKRPFQIFCAVLVVVVSVVCGYAQYNSTRVWQVPYPPITADTRPEAVARGHMIFETKCGGCHQAPGDARVVGQRMADAPAFLGEFYPSNLTRDPSVGAGRFRDDEIARLIRYGITPRGTPIMGWALADDDIAAVLGYLRSDDPRFDADPTVQPKTRFTLVGKLVLAFVIGGPPNLPAEGVHAPPPTDTLNYGEYLAKEVFECSACHTPGFAGDKAEGPDAFRGGFEVVGADGKPLFTRNLTFHENGLKGWSLAQFRTALRDGVTPRGEGLRAPMQRYRLVDDASIAAMYEYLKSLPAKESAAPVDARPGPLPEAAHVAASESKGPALFQQFGCVACHAPGMPQHEKVVAAKGKDAMQLAQWVRNPQRFKPTSQMPAFASVMSEEQAKALGQWLSAGALATPE